MSDLQFCLSGHFPAAQRSPHWWLHHDYHWITIINANHSFTIVQASPFHHFSSFHDWFSSLAIYHHDWCSHVFTKHRFIHHHDCKWFQITVVCHNFPVVAPLGSRVWPAQMAGRPWPIEVLWRLQWVLSQRPMLAEKHLDCEPQGPVSHPRISTHDNHHACSSCTWGFHAQRLCLQLPHQWLFQGLSICRHNKLQQIPAPCFKVEPGARTIPSSPPEVSFYQATANRIQKEGIKFESKEFPLWFKLN